MTWLLTDQVDDADTAAGRAAAENRYEAWHHPYHDPLDVTELEAEREDQERERARRWAS